MDAIVELELDAIAHGGEAIGRHAGKAVFVPYAMPGERVSAQIVDEKERWARARLVDVLRPAPDRVTPPCPYFGAGGCSGCQWQHIAYPRQAELKQEIVRDQLRRLGHIPDPAVAETLVIAGAPETAGGPAPLLDFGYRSAVRFALTSDRRLGLPREGSREIMAIERCLLLSERLDALHAALDVVWPGLTGVSMRVGADAGEALIVLESESQEQPELEIDIPAACALLTPAGLVALVGEPYIIAEAASRRYRVSARTAFPPSATGASALVDVVAEYAMLRASDVLVDAYCGAGLFTMALAGCLGEVIGIESSASACEDFAANAGDLTNVTLHEGAVEDVLPVLLAEGQRADAVILGPPRSGAGRAVLAGLAALGPRCILYVASDPATLARDAPHLIEAGWRLAEVQPVDLLPQTHRIHAVALWARD